MKFKYYLAQTKPGNYDVSIPWLPPLAQATAGTSPSQLEEGLIFRLMELIHQELEPKFLHALIPPEQLQIIGVYVDVSYQKPGQMPVSAAGVIQCVLGQWPGQEVTNIWIPGVPGVCLAIQDQETIFETINRWATGWMEASGLEDFDTLIPPQTSHIAEFSFEPGLPPAIFRPGQRSAQQGRMRHPQTLEQVATNLVHRVADEALQSAYGREQMLEELVDTMTSPSAFGICLVGPPNVGKTALIGEAVNRVWRLQKAYQERRDFWETSGDRIVAGMSVVGQWEQRVTTMVEELSERDDVLVVEDLLGLVRAGQVYQGDSNVARFIEPFLEQGRFSLMVEATPETFAAARTLAPGFVDRFHVLHVPAMNYKETIHVLHKVVREIEQAHESIRTTPDALELMMTITERFYSQDAWPGKAVRLAKQCESAALRLIHQQDALSHEDVLIDTELVSDVFRAQTGLPRAILEPGHGRAPRVIREALGAQVFGQKQAVDVCTNLIVMIEQGMGDPDKPLGSFLFVGPSGVGKTETAKALARQLFGSSDRLIRFDMSEFNTPLAISRLIGTTRQPDGELTSRVRLQPFCVVLLDEIEKADPSIFDLLLQVLGEGRLTDAAGRTVDMRNAIVVMTSNLGANMEQKWLGFQNQSVQEHILHYTKAASEFFRPEFMGRVDAVVPYVPLRARALRLIAKRALTALLNRRGLRHAQVMVDLDEHLVDRLIEDAIDPRYGARTLARRIEKLLIAPLAKQLAQRTDHEGLTRVRITNGVEEGVMVNLLMEQISQAPRVHQEETPPMTADSLAELARRQVSQAPELEAQKIIESLMVLRAILETLASRPEVASLEVDYQRLLREFNDPAGQQRMMNPQGNGGMEKLRQSEMFLRHLERTRVRLEGLLDPRGEGAVVVPIAQEFDPRKRRLWAQELVELECEGIGLEVQLQSLISRQQDGATLVCEVLSGPSLEPLNLWHRILHELGAHFELELSIAAKQDHQWRSFKPTHLSNPETRALAFSGSAPGIFALLRAMAGYVWVPQHANSGVADSLMRVTVHDEAPVGRQVLLEELNRGVFKQSANEEQMFIEFILQHQHLRDTRLGRELSLPEKKSRELRRFVLRLVMARVASQGDVYQKRMQSGVYQALPVTRKGDQTNAKP